MCESCVFELTPKCGPGLRVQRVRSILPVSPESSAERDSDRCLQGFRTQRNVWSLVRAIRNLRTGGRGRADDKLTVRIDWLDEGGLVESAE